MEIEINDDLLTIILLYSLSDDFENFRIAIETRDILPSPQVLKIKILEEWEARKEHSKEYSSNEALLGKFQKKHVFQPNFRVPFRCHVCKAIGHKARFCPKARKEVQNSAVAKEERTGFHSAVEDKCYMGNILNKQDVRWCLDSGCTSHMTYLHSKFVNCQPDMGRSVNLANNSSTDAKGIGTVNFFG